MLFRSVELVTDDLGKHILIDLLQLPYTSVRTDQQQREVLNLRFGLSDGQSLTLAKIGDRLKISRERVRQVEREALVKLRKRKTGVMGYLVS